MRLSQLAGHQRSWKPKKPFKTKEHLVAGGFVLEEGDAADGLLGAARHRQGVDIVAVAYADACAGKESRML